MSTSSGLQAPSGLVGRLQCTGPDKQRRDRGTSGTAGTQFEAEAIAEDLLGRSYFDLSAVLKRSDRARAIEALWPVEFSFTAVPAA